MFRVMSMTTLISCVLKTLLKTIGVAGNRSSLADVPFCVTNSFASRQQRRATRGLCFVSNPSPGGHVVSIIKFRFVHSIVHSLLYMTFRPSPLDSNSVVKLRRSCEMSLVKWPSLPRNPDHIGAAYTGGIRH